MPRRMRNTMGLRMRESREAHGMTLTDVAAAAGIAASHLSRIERRQTAPSFLVASRIAAMLGVQPSELATIQCDQAAIDDALLAALSARGMDPVIAEEIMRRIATLARRALLEALTTS